jgi:signal transduction histidine kinase
MNIRQLLSDLRGEPGVEHDFVESVRQGLLRNFELETGIKVRLTATRRWNRRLPSSTAINLYRILQESLNNVRLHSAAREVAIRLWVAADGTAELSVRDDGVGFNELADARYRGMGWLGMKERAALLGGRLTIRPLRGGGTRVRASFPRILGQTVLILAQAATVTL